MKCPYCGRQNHPASPSWCIECQEGKAAMMRDLDRSSAILRTIKRKDGEPFKDFARRCKMALAFASN